MKPLSYPEEAKADTAPVASASLHGSATAAANGNMSPPVDTSATQEHAAAKPKYRHQWFQASLARLIACCSLSFLLAESLSVVAHSLRAWWRWRHVASTMERCCDVEEQRLRVATSDAEGKQDYELFVELYSKVNPQQTKWVHLHARDRAFFDWLLCTSE